MISMEHVHLVGIGGAGLSAIATILLERGTVVSGSDCRASSFTDSLTTAGADVFIGHRASQISGADIVLVSSAIPSDNPEILAARASCVPVVRRQEFVGKLMEGQLGIAVAGTHGKTTTTALLAYVLHQAGLEPSFIVGGVINDLGTNAHHGLGKPFVVEADEYDRMFLGLRPELAVITNVEYDHPDCYTTALEVRDAFKQFIELLPSDGVLVVSRDDPVAEHLGDEASDRGVQVVTYSVTQHADWRASSIKPNKVGGCDFEVFHGSSGNSQPLRIVSSRLAGLHNVGNVLAVLAVLDSMGLVIDETIEWLHKFRGVGRRFDVRGEVNDIMIVDDYAHHPTEIRATLASARLHYPGRVVWALFQPHTFSRTRVMLADIAASFTDADHVLVTDIFAGREHDSGTISSEDIVPLMEHPDAQYVPSLEGALRTLVEGLQPGDVLITMGAGDSHTVADGVLESLSERRGNEMVSWI